MTRRVQRPDPAAPDAHAGVPRLRLSARQPVGPAPRALVSRRRLPRLAGRHAQHAHARDQRRDVRARRGGEAVSAHRLASGGLIDRARPLSFTLRRADVLSGFAGDTLASALMANGVQAGRALVQVSPPARHPDRRLRGAERAGRAAHRRAARAEHARDHGRALRRARRGEPEPLAVARVRSRRDQRLARAVPRRRLLLQDLHVAGDVLGDALRAADPPRRRPRPRGRRGAIPTTTRRPTRIATCW